MKKYLSSFVVLGIGTMFSLAVIGSVMAQDVEYPAKDVQYPAKDVVQSPIKDVQRSAVKDVQYPVKELGSCKSEKECKVYCDKTKNMDACLSFGEKNNLMSKEETSIAKNFAKKEMKGPGGCDGKDGCDAYCNNMDNMDECVSFAEKNNLMPAKELEEAKKVQAAIKRGVKPPACGNKNACDAYCEESNHMEECINFGVEAGFIQGEELENAQKMLSALKRGIKPPPCKGKDACDEYCSNPDNMEICMNFAMEAGMMSDQEKENSQKMLQAIKKGVKPPKCRGQQECDAYCQSEEHMDECINFSVAAGMMDEKQAEMAKKTRGKGPGGCMGKEACDAFCQNNQEECFKFGVENGMIPQEELQRMEQDKANFKQTFNNLPPEVETCLKESIGSEQVEKFKSGGIMPQKEMGEGMRVCFEKNMPQPGQKCEGDNCPTPGEGGDMGMQMAPGTTGPSGCKTQEECQKYCESKPEECQKFQPGPGVINPGGQMMPQQAGPGGCKSPEECKTYCEKNSDQCKNFKSMGMEGQQMQPSSAGGQMLPTTMQMPIEMQQQMNQQFQQNMQQPPTGMPTGGGPVPAPGQQPMNIQLGPGGDQSQMMMQQIPTGMQQPMDQQNMQQNMQQLPPPDGEQPQSRIQKQSLLGAVVSAFLSLFK